MAYQYFTDLNTRTAANTVLSDKAFNFAKSSKHDGYQRGLPSIADEFFNKKAFVGAFKNEFISN